MTAATEQQLAALYRQLSADDRATLLAFAQFLASRPGQTATVAASEPPAPPAAVPEPLAIERPQQESIVAGLKRLAKTYPMLDRGEMLGATSDLVATHIMKGTAASVVIDELEAVFEKHYRRLKDGPESS